MISKEFLDSLRYRINRFIFDHGFAPDSTELASICHTGVEEVRAGLQALAVQHALVLHPHSDKIWVAHPFALFPTLFWVKTGDKQWWGNCTWCSLGIAALAKDDTDIYTKLQGEEEPIVIHIREGEVLEKDLVAHLPIPAARFWDNVIYTCANILAFKSEKDVEAWCRRHNISKGKTLPVGQLWELSKLWYGNYIDPQFQHKTKEIAQSMFEQVGLTGDFWKL